MVIKNALYDKVVRTTEFKKIWLLKMFCMIKW